MNPAEKPLGPQYVVLMAVNEPMTRDEFVGKLDTFYQNPLSKTKISLVKSTINDKFGKIQDIDLQRDKLPVEVLTKYRDEFFMSKGKEGREVVHLISSDANEAAARATIAEHVAAGTPIQQPAAPTETLQPPPPSASSSSASSSQEPVGSAPSWWLGVVNAVVKTVSPYLSTNLQTYMPGKGEGFKDDDEMVRYVIRAKKKLGIEDQAQNDNNVEKK